MAIVLDGTSGITTPALDSTARFATADMPLGSVLQVVSATLTTSPTNISSTSYVDTGVSASITPTSASSKILVLVHHNAAHYQQTNAARRFSCNLFRGATSIATTEGASNGAVSANGFFEGFLNFDFVYMDSPATTSSTTYKTQAKVSDTASSTTIQINSSSAPATITLMEIAA